MGEKDAQPSSLMFEGPRGATDACSLTKRLSKFFKRTSWPTVQSHDFRKSCITHVYKKTGDINLCKEMAGHTDIRTT